MRTSIQNKADFSKIRYANCWEDADILLEALDIKPTDKVLSVASGGDNSFSMLSKSPQKVVAVDINPFQLYLVELKREAIRQLSYTEAKQFLGFEEMDNRWDMYLNLRTGLSKSASGFWDFQMETINAGVIYAGKFEKYFSIYRRWVHPLLSTKKETQLFFAGEPSLDYREKNDKKMRSPFVKMMFKLFFSKTVMGILGRSPAFFEHVKIHVGDYIYNKTRSVVANPESYKNGFLHFIVLGNFNKKLPHYMRPENFDAIKMNIDRMEIREISIEQAVCEEEFTKFNLSNIFEYMDSNNFAAILKLLVKHSNRGAMFAFWNLMVERKLSDVVPSLFIYHRSRSNALSQKDKLFFYHNFILEERL
jgi:S-adenosylmethionine-diacylglycerol 3-amino-3-carboxypropyl transferase